MKLNTLFKKLQAAGLQCEKILLSGYAEPLQAISVNTDYNGLQPSADTWEKINACRKLAGKNFHIETRGHYTAVYIWEVPAV